MRMAKAKNARNQTSETKFSSTPHQFLGLCLGNGILMHLTCCCCCLRWTAVLVGPEVEISYVWGQSLLLQKGKEKNHCKIQDDIYVVKIVLSSRHQSSGQASLYLAGFYVLYNLFSVARRFKITSGWRVAAVVASHPATESHSTHCPLIQFVF